MANTVTETITPQKARMYLDSSLGNRPISRQFVTRYAADMRAGKWMVNGVPIIFDEDGHLIDGHHRLEAVLVANVPVTFDVRRGVQHAAYTTIDNGRSRNFGQILASRGVRYYKIVAGIVISNEILLRHGRLLSANILSNGEVRLSNDDKVKLYEKDPEGFEIAAETISKLHSRCRIIKASWAGGIYYYLRHYGGYTHEEVYTFFDALYSLDSSTIGPCDILRKIITKASLSGKTISAEYLWAYLCKAWNCYVAGESPKLLKYGTNEEIPTLKLKNKN